MIAPTAVSVAQMSGPRWRVLLGTALVSGLLSALSLLAPWARSGRVDRSLFGLIASASALDLLSGFAEVVAVVAVVAVAALVSVALVATAWSRHRIAAVALLGPGPILLVAAVVVARTPLALRWGAVAGSTMGMVGSICVIMILLSDAKRRDPHS